MARLRSDCSGVDARQLSRHNCVRSWSRRDPLLARAYARRSRGRERWPDHGRDERRAESADADRLRGSDLSHRRGSSGAEPVRLCVGNAVVASGTWPSRGSLVRPSAWVAHCRKAEACCRPLTPSRAPISIPAACNRRSLRSTSARRIGVSTSGRNGVRRSGPSAGFSRPCLRGGSSSSLYRYVRSTWRWAWTAALCEFAIRSIVNSVLTGSSRSLGSCVSDWSSTASVRCDSREATALWFMASGRGRRLTGPPSGALGDGRP